MVKNFYKHNLRKEIFCFIEIENVRGFTFDSNLRKQMLQKRNIKR